MATTMVIIEPPKVHLLQSLVLFTFGSISAGVVKSEWSEIIRLYNKTPEEITAELQEEANRLCHIDKSESIINVAEVLARAQA